MSSTLGAPEAPIPSGSGAGRRREILLVFGGLVVMMAPRLLSTSCTGLLADDLVTLRLGQLLWSGCHGLFELPWNHQPLLPAIGGAVLYLAEALGVSHQGSIDLAIRMDRQVAAFGPVVGWLLFRKSLPPGLPRFTFFALCALSPLGLAGASRGMGHGAAALPVALALAGFAGWPSAARSSWILAGLALLAALATSWAAFPVAVGFGLAALWIAGRAWKRGEGPAGWLSPLLALLPAALFAAWWVPGVASSGIFEARLGTFDEIRLTPWRDILGFPAFSLGGRAASTWGVGSWLLGGVLVMLMVWGSFGRLSFEPESARRPYSWERLGPALGGLAWGAWVGLLLALPFAWMGMSKWLPMLLVPTALLASRGLARLVAAGPAARLAGWAMAIVVLSGLGLGVRQVQWCIPAEEGLPELEDIVEETDWGSAEPDGGWGCQRGENEPPSGQPPGSPGS